MFQTVLSFTKGATSSSSVICNCSSINTITSAKAILSDFFWLIFALLTLKFLNALYWLVNLFMQFSWYLASLAMRSPSESFANSCISSISVAACRIFLSQSNDSTQCRTSVFPCLTALVGHFHYQSQISHKKRHFCWFKALMSEFAFQVSLHDFRPEFCLVQLKPAAVWIVIPLKHNSCATSIMRRCSAMSEFPFKSARAKTGLLLKLIQCLMPKRNIQCLMPKRNIHMFLCCCSEQDKSNSSHQPGRVRICSSP